MLGYKEMIIMEDFHIVEVSFNKDAEALEKTIYQSDILNVVHKHTTYIEIEGTEEDIIEYVGHRNPYININSEFKPIGRFDESKLEQSKEDDESSLSLKNEEIFSNPRNLPGSFE